MARLLVVSFPYPPFPSVGGNRWAAMRRHLVDRGHAVTVLTTSAFGVREEDAVEDIVRTGDLMASPTLRRLLRRPPLMTPQGDAPPADPAPPGVLTRAVVPDAYLASWAPYALVTARRLLRERPFDAIVTTTPYESAHLVGLACRRSAAWLADFRDGWVFDSHRPPFYTAWQHRLDERLERTVVRRADAVLAATRPIAEDFSARLGVAAHHVPNGWEPAGADGPPTPAPGLLEPDRVNLVYTGTLSGGWGRDPRPLLTVLQGLGDEPEVASRLRLVIAGRLSERERALLDELGGPLVRHVGMLDRDGAQALQRAADGLVLITSRNPSEATGKLFEYLGTGRPILALAEGNEAARIVTETRTGLTVAPDDEAAIDAVLRRATQGALADAHHPVGLEPYTYPGPALAVERIVEDAVARRAAR
jgi:glycosyltransferase involved in cell wall biosynthesis